MQKREEQMKKKYSVSKIPIKDIKQHQQEYMRYKQENEEERQRKSSLNR